MPFATDQLCGHAKKPTTQFIASGNWDIALGMDLFVANNATNYIYFGDGTGLFDGPAPGSLPAVQNRLTFPGGAANTVAAFVADWNSDFALTPDIITVDDPGGGGAAIITQHIITPNAPGTAPTITSTPFPAGALANPRCCAGTFYNADLIILSDLGQGAAREILIGSTAHAVLHGSTVPVLLVPVRGSSRKPSGRSRSR